MNFLTGTKKIDVSKSAKGFLEKSKGYTIEGINIANYFFDSTEVASWIQGADLLRNNPALKITKKAASIAGIGITSYEAYEFITKNDYIAEQIVYDAYWGQMFADTREELHEKYSFAYFAVLNGMKEGKITYTTKLDSNLKDYKMDDTFRKEIGQVLRDYGK